MMLRFGLLMRKQVSLAETFIFSHLVGWNVCWIRVQSIYAPAVLYP